MAPIESVLRVGHWQLGVPNYLLQVVPTGTSVFKVVCQQLIIQNDKDFKVHEESKDLMAYILGERTGGVGLLQSKVQGGGKTIT